MKKQSRTKNFLIGFGLSFLVIIFAFAILTTNSNFKSIKDITQKDVFVAQGKNLGEIICLKPKQRNTQNLNNKRIK